VTFPLKNIPAVVLENPDSARAVTAALHIREEERVFLVIPGMAAPSYGEVEKLADILAEGFGQREILVCLEADCAKALGQSIRLLVGDKPCICMDGLSLWGESYLDVGAPVGPALPVVMKTLVLGGTP
jgi:ethanolamine utilization protein EutA